MNKKKPTTQQKAARAKFVKIMDKIGDEFMAHELTVEQVAFVLSEYLAHFCSVFISEPSSSEKEIEGVLRHIFTTLKAGVEEGWAKRAQQEKKKGLID